MADRITSPEPLPSPPDFSRLRVLVVGDVILDRYVWGQTDRISPEAPVPVVLEGPTTEVLGGATNVARNLVGAGARAEMVGAVGRDAEARRVRELLARLGIARRGLVVEARRPTTVKTRVMTRGQQLLRMDREVVGPYGEEIEAKLLAAIERILPDVDAMIVSDYRKGVVGAELARRAMALGRRRGIPVVADPKVADFRHYEGADYLTPNLKEAAASAGEALDTLEAIERAGRRLARRFKGRGIAITRGHEGVSLIEGSRRAVHIPANAREVFDVTGAGDTFIAYFTLGLAGGLAPDESARIANAAGGISVSKLGAVTVGPEELAAALGGPDSLAKVRTREDMCLVADYLRESRKRIVLTNGCFDLFHAGHVHLLHRAREQGDALIVALNTDRSVRRIKGKPRPILPAAERAAVLSALAVVDYVVFFGEDSPENLLRELRPDVLVKGREAGKPVIGAEIVRGYGGEVVEVDLFEGASTGRLVRKIRQSRSRKP